MKRAISIRLTALCCLMLASPAGAQLISAYPARPGSAGPSPGTDLARHTLNYGDSRCNDGSAAVAYVQAGVGNAAQNWVIFLEGGGSCDSAQDCMDRWQAYAGAAGIQKMSTRIPRAVWNGWHPAGTPHAGAPPGWTVQGPDYAVPPGIVGNGILSTAAANPFSGWTKVYANYCSSDKWTGLQTGIATTATNRATGAAVPVTYPFLGASIFDRLIGDLRTGVTACVSPGAFCQALPSLSAANTVLLAGSSGGGAGVLNNLDRFRVQQRLVNPATQVRGVFDGSSPPSRQTLPWPVLPVPGIPFTSYQQMIDQSWAQTYRGLWLARVDDTCVAANIGVESRCADNAHVLRHHITSPFFVRQDQQDSLGMEHMLPFFPVPPYAAGVAALELSQNTSTHLADLAGMISLLTPRYMTELALITADAQWIAPVLFGPRCGNHTALLEFRPWAQQELPIAGVPVNFATALATWVAMAPTGIASPAGTATLAPVGAGLIPGAPCN